MQISSKTEVANDAFERILILKPTAVKLWSTNSLLVYNNILLHFFVFHHFHSSCMEPLHPLQIQEVHNLQTHNFPGKDKLL